jgi:hypothetical protein
VDEHPILYVSFIAAILFCDVTAYPDKQKVIISIVKYEVITAVTMKNVASSEMLLIVAVVTTDFS